MASRSFKDLYFGMASAEYEASQDSERFYRTYYDRWNISRSIEQPEYFLIVGPKGVGKSAVSEYIRLSLIQRFGSHAVFARTLNLDEVSPGISPISSITQKLAADRSAGITDSAWRLFLSLRYFELLMQDQSCRFSDSEHVMSLAEELKRSGLQSGDFPTVLRRVRENKISISLKGLLGGDRSTKETDEVSVANLGASLQRLLLNVETDNHFLLAIDGLDRIINDNPAYWNTLAALLRVADEMHRMFCAAPLDLRLLVMCRSDVFRSIQFADADKIAGDAALFIDWAAHQTKPAESHLWDYICAKAQISTSEFFRMLPDEVIVGQRSGRPKGIKIAEYLLQFTRSTPRELTMLLKRLQEEIPSSGYVNSDRVRLAADTFASRDLLTIVNAEATGVLQQEVHGKLVEVISNIPSAVNFKKEDLRFAMERAELDQNLIGILSEFLFMAGLIGNFDPQTGYYQFYHRRDTYKFKRSGPWALRRGLMYAFNIPYSRPAQTP